MEFLKEEQYTTRNGKQMRGCLKNLVSYKKKCTSKNVCQILYHKTKQGFQSSQDFLNILPARYTIWPVRYFIMWQDLLARLYTSIFKG